jgi:myo-inositol-1(or 4)-monophosphatase
MISSPLMTVMVDAARKAARSLRRDFGEVENLQVSRKGPGDFVSAADRKAEEVLRDALLKARPGYGMILEEGGIIEGSDKSHTWHIDGIIVAGVVFDPIKDELFVAERGKGAYLNNRRLRVAARTEMADALVGYGTPYLGRGSHPRLLREMAAVMAVSGGTRRMGSAALDLAYVACGRLDAYWERDLQTYDFAGGVALVREAGGFVTSADGAAEPLASRSVVCGNESLHREMLAILKKAQGAA